MHILYVSILNILTNFAETYKKQIIVPVETVDRYDQHLPTYLVDLATVRSGLVQQRSLVGRHAEAIPASLARSLVAGPSHWNYKRERADPPS